MRSLAAVAVLATAAVAASPVIAGADPFPASLPLYTAPAPADPPPADPAITAPGMVAPAAPADAQPVREPYRMQIAAASLLPVGVYLAEAAGNNSDYGDAFAVATISSYALAAPLVHLAHRHAGRAVTSLVLRVGLPLLGGLIGSAAGSSRCNNDCDISPSAASAMLGVLGGSLAASAIDVGYLANGDGGTGWSF